MGIDRTELSPGLQRKLVSAGTRHSSFANASQDVADLMDLQVNAKRIERLTERIGAERCAQRDAEVERYVSLPLTQRKDKPEGVTAPTVAVAGVDGGRVQIFERPHKASALARPQAVVAAPDAAAVPSVTPATPHVPDVTDARDVSNATDQDASLPPDEKHRGRHWREDKIGVLMTMKSDVSAHDPCPQVPTAFVDPTRIVKLTRELKTKRSAAEVAAHQEAAQPTAQPEVVEEVLHQAGQAVHWRPPEVTTKQLAATRRSWSAFGPIMAMRAWRLGFFAAQRKAFLGDGSDNNWTMWRERFSSFVPILDLIHAISYVFAAAMAGQAFAQGWVIYVRWVTWVWQGEVARVIEELVQRQAELGLPLEGDGETHPRVVVATALGYLQRHQDKMRYADYRRQGLPITSSYVESAVKQFNQRVKGTEKFWTEAGAEALLQLRGDHLSDDTPMPEFWQHRQESETGLRNYEMAV